MAQISIPLLMKDVTGGARQAEVAATTLADVIAGLDQLYPGIAARLLSGEHLSPNVTFVVDGSIAMRGLQTPVSPHSQVSILPAFGGG